MFDKDICSFELKVGRDKPRKKARWSNIQFLHTLAILPFSEPRCTNWDLKLDNLFAVAGQNPLASTSIASFFIVYRRRCFQPREFYRHWDYSFLQLGGTIILYSATVWIKLLSAYLHSIVVCQTWESHLSKATVLLFEILVLVNHTQLRWWFLTIVQHFRSCRVFQIQQLPFYRLISQYTEFAVKRGMMLLGQGNPSVNESFNPSYFSLSS